MSEADIIISAEDRLGPATADAVPRAAASGLLSPGALTQLGRLWRRRADDDAPADDEPDPVEPGFAATDYDDAGYDNADYDGAVAERMEPTLTAPAASAPAMAAYDEPDVTWAPPRTEPVLAAPVLAAPEPAPARAAEAARPLHADTTHSLHADTTHSLHADTAMLRPSLRARLRAQIRRRLPRLGLTPLQQLAAGGIGVLTVTVTAAVVWHSGIIQRTTQAGVNAVFAATGRAGFRIEDITVAGRARTSMDQISAALAQGFGSPILAIDLDEVKDRLEALPSVRQAAVERVLPGTLHIALAERQPIAVWQNNGEHVLVDDEGKVIPGSIAGYEALPLVVGDGAGQRADEILAMLSSEPALASRVKAAIRVGNRRWNLMLDDAEEGLEIRLPEDEAEAAWHRLAELERQQGLSTRHVRMVDLRLPDRLILKTERPATLPETLRHKDNGAG